MIDLRRRLLFASAAFAIFGAKPAIANPLHIMIDPGHGGTDTGASHGHLKESEIALKVSQLLAEELRNDPRFKVSLTRTRDVKIPLTTRAKLAEQAKADLFVSIHLNSSPDPRAHGIEVYFQNQLPADEEAMFLVSRESEDSGEGVAAEPTETNNDSLTSRSDLKRILEDLARNHRIEQSSELGKTLYQTLLQDGPHGRPGNRAVRQAPFYVVANNKVPAVLVEIGFLSNAQDGPRLGQAQYQRELARGLYDGLVKFKETVDTQSAETVKSQASNPTPAAL